MIPPSPPEVVKENFCGGAASFAASFTDAVHRFPQWSPQRPWGCSRPLLDRYRMVDTYSSTSHRNYYPQASFFSSPLQFKMCYQLWLFRPSNTFYRYPPSLKVSLGTPIQSDTAFVSCATQIAVDDTY